MVASLEGKSNDEKDTQETDKDFLKPPESHVQEKKCKTVKKNIVKVRVVVKCNKYDSLTYAIIFIFT